MLSQQPTGRCILLMLSLRHSRLPALQERARMRLPSCFHRRHHLTKLAAVVGLHTCVYWYTRVAFIVLNHFVRSCSHNFALKCLQEWTTTTTIVTIPIRFTPLPHLKDHPAYQQHKILGRSTTSLTLRRNRDEDFQRLYSANC